LEVVLLPTKDKANGFDGLIYSPDAIFKFRQLPNKSQEGEQKYHVLQNLISEAVVVVQNGRIKECNQIMHRLCGYSLEEVFEKPFVNFFHPDNLPVILSICKQPKERENTFKVYEVILICKDGRQKNIEITTDLCTFERKPASLIVMQDISDRIKTKKNLENASKLESLAALAGGIAHDYNNLLTAIIGNISLSQVNLKPDDKSFSLLNQALTASKTAQDLTQKLITFSKGGEPVKTIADFAKLVKSAAEFTLSGSTIKCEYEFPHDLWSVIVDKSQIGQAIHNVVLNAREAMIEGGIIKITARNTILKQNFLTLKPGNFVKLSISDQGEGISANELEKIFEPYYTTKEFGTQKGTGLGLPISKSIIKKHGGDIEVRSEIGFGTTFFLYLPADLNVIASKKPTSKTETEKPIFGEGKILVMDDEEIIRTLTKQILTHLGYNSEYAHDGKEAVELYQKSLRNGKPFDAVILDLTVRGGMGGKEAIRKLSEIDPNIKCIVSSGYPKDPVIMNYREFGFCGAIGKPYTVDELGEILHKVLK
jgi:PAS domain S-box-containing protein